MFLPPRKCDSVDPTEWRSTAQVQPLRAVKKGKRRERDDCSLRHVVFRLLIVGSTALAFGEMRWRTVVSSTEDTIATMTRHLVLRLYDGEVAQEHK